MCFTAVFGIAGSFLKTGNTQQTGIMTGLGSAVWSWAAYYTAHRILKPDYLLLVFSRIIWSTWVTSWYACIFFSLILQKKMIEIIFQSFCIIFKVYKLTVIWCVSNQCHSLSSICNEIFQYKIILLFWSICISQFPIPLLIFF